MINMRRLIIDFVGSIIKVIKINKGDCMEIQETSAVVSFFPLGRKGKGTIRVYKSPENLPVEIALQSEGTLIPHDAIKFSMGILQAVEYAIKLQKERDNGKQSGNKISNNKV